MTGPSMHPSVAIIIPALNSPLIGRVLDSIMEQDGVEKIDEIIIVGKDEAGFIPTHPQLTFIDTGMPVKSPRARNIGIEKSSAQLLLFLDSDCLAEPGWLREHLAAHEAGYDVVGGGVAPTGAGYWQLTYNLSLFHEFYATAPAGPRDYFPTLNLSVHRAAIERAGLMDEVLPRGEDIEWTMRLARSGSSLYFAPSATVVHAHNRTTLSDVWLDCAGSGYYMRQVRLENPDQMRAPAWLRYRWAVLLLSPLIAAGVVLRIVASRPSTLLRRWYTLPGLYLTKIAWCWGASRREEPT
jgi:glycosyltransferase involved in cell wall biosynthesis